MILIDANPSKQWNRQSVFIQRTEKKIKEHSMLHTNSFIHSTKEIKCRNMYTHVGNDIDDCSLNWF